MGRFIKNLICILIIFGMFACMYFTMMSVKEQYSNKDSFEPGDGIVTNMTPPDKPEGDMQPPGKPEGMGNMTPPDKPDEMENMTSPDMVDGELSMAMLPESSSEMDSDAELDTKYVILFALEGAVAGLVIMYLIVSSFNGFSFRNTFQSTGKTIICMFGTIVFCIAFTFVDMTIANRYITSSGGNDSSGGIVNGKVSYSAKKNITSNSNIDKGSFSSSSKNQNAIGIKGDVEVTLSNISVSKTGDSDSGDDTSFYGINSAIIAREGADVTMSNITVNTGANGANGVFSYGGSATTQNSSGDGTVINISDSKITTTKDNSGGVMITGGGSLNATNLTISTSGTSSAAIRSDRGGGKVIISGGTYTTSGKGSPAIYSTADITVKDAVLNSNSSEGVVIEGKNSVNLERVKLNDTNNVLHGKSTTYKNIFIYQSMSGDADSGEGIFTSKESIITTNVGDTFYVTNTKATINLENNKITNTSLDGGFLRIQSDSWGNSGSNGGNVTLNLNNQEVNGNIVVDGISTLVINATNNSKIISAINTESYLGEITLNLDKSSKFTLSGDTYITSLNNEVDDYSNIDFNKHVLYINRVAVNKVD